MDGQGLVSGRRRQQELAALLELLEGMRSTAVSAQGELKRLHKHLLQALPRLLAFVAPLERVEQEMVAVVGESGLALVAWAWQRRAILGPQLERVVPGLPEDWRAAARVLMHGWEGAVGASSAVENWHSILRPHLAVHRGLSAGLLAVLAVWHNHRLFTRGVHQGHSPLQLSGMEDAPTDWLLALGYPPADHKLAPTPAQVAQAERALAA